MATQPLTATEIHTRIQDWQGWSLVNGKLHKTFRFPSFVEAFGWMTQVALVAERMGHHPEWFNVYNRVEVDLMTHDAQGITALDLTLAEMMDAYAT